MSKTGKEDLLLRWGSNSPISESTPLDIFAQVVRPISSQRIHQYWYLRIISSLKSYNTIFMNKLGKFDCCQLASTRQHYLVQIDDQPDDEYDIRCSC
jgi:hypothetical protein